MSAQDYNLASAGKLWQPYQLPPTLLSAWQRGPREFVTQVEALQRLCGLPVDGKLGPNTLKRIGGAPVATETLQGFDVSGYQPIERFDEAKLRASGMAWAAVKVSQEHGASNRYAQEHIDLFLSCGLAVMPYHFSDVSEDPCKQADLLCSRGAQLFHGRKSLPPMVDIEWFKDHNSLDKSKFRTWLPKHITRIRDNTTRNPVLYTGRNFWAEHVGAMLPDLGPVELFTVDYTHPEAPPSLPVGFMTYTFRQHTGSGRVPWYGAGRFDIDLGTFNGDRTALERLVQ